MLNRNRALLLVVDFQERLMPKIPVADEVTAQAVRLIRFAKKLELPVIVTEQYPKGLGPTTAAIKKVLAKTKAVEKTAFGCFGDDKFVSALESSSRRQLLVCGVETHVCVMQTVLEGLLRGYECYVTADAVASRDKFQHALGIKRMAEAGATIVTAEMAMFEILREAGTPEFKRVLPLLK